MFHIIPLTLAVSAGGALTLADTNFINGLLWEVHYVPGTLDTGADLTISTINSAVAKTLLTITNAGTSTVNWYPRASTCGATGTVTTDNAVLLPVVGRLQVVVAQGGTSTTGTMVITILE